eukprot:m.260414 g.260414  ORF g.260414 m.260414 type:complete len:582 (+) comp39860_c0_seq1:108-1853(+)
MARFLFVAFALVVALHVNCIVVNAEQLAIHADSTTNVITVDASDLELATSSPTGKVSLLGVVASIASLTDLSPTKKDLQDVMQTMKAATDLINQNVDTLNQSVPSRLEMTTSIDAAVTGGVELAMQADSQLITDLTKKLDALTLQLASFDATKKTVAKLALDVEYLLQHAENVTTCANDSQVHVGDGACVSPVPTCAAPDAPVGGAVVVSSPYIIPGVTATYTCTREGYFVSGNVVRTCDETSRAFAPVAEAKCLECLVVNCITCITDQQHCGECAFGHDLSSDGTSCDERQEHVVVFGGSPPNSGHNWREAQQLPPNADSWQRFYPTPPVSASRGSAAIIRGDCFVVNGNNGVKLSRGSSAWSTIATPPMSFGQLPFYATVNGVGTKEDGFYILSTTGSAVYKPKDDAWTRLPLHSDQGGDASLRCSGATAVIGNKIYVFGGVAKTSYSDEVDIFDTTKRTWSEGVAMTSKRMGMAAAVYNKKIYLIGGELNGIYLDLVEEFDPATSGWTTKKSMIEPWSMMTTGPLPVFADGSVVIPHAYRRGNLRTSVVYDAKKNTWREGQSPPLMGGRYAIVIGSLE